MSNTISSYGVLDLFAGPGGLAEGFSEVRDSSDNRIFNIDLSVEKDKHAHSTLQLRAFLRHFADQFPAMYYEYVNGNGTLEDLIKCFPNIWRRASREAVCRELGQARTSRFLSLRIKRMKALFGDRTVLIGGPPCQAYSLVGRARNRGTEGYVPEQDSRHFLYREFLKVLEELQPAAFVMENVKGMLSSSVDGSLIARTILKDLETASSGYTLIPLATNRKDSTETNKPGDFVIKAEEHGIPQARHRVIIVGFRTPLLAQHRLNDILALAQIPVRPAAIVKDVLTGMSRLRSSISFRASRDIERPDWFDHRTKAAKRLTKYFEKSEPEMAKVFKAIAAKKPGERGCNLNADTVRNSRVSNSCPSELASWICDPHLSKLSNTETRSHMASDLDRYLFASTFAKIKGFSPKSQDFPAFLAPAHLNWNTGNFADRFRVQLSGRPSSTVTSHISKDGHFYIHPDPEQCRSLTVREAARLQTFPDNYHFLGPRTQQYHQVGNAVPPYLSFQIAQTILPILNLITGVSGDQRQESMQPNVEAFSNG